ncbi:MAG: BACON domain-containing protein, partial [Bacteroidales bacterium]|nr:BACON domain-containing protein [Bacteroidales bacterium]
MKKYIYLFFAAVFVTMACVPQDPQVQFGVDSDNIEIGPAGGKRLINVSSADNWTAMVQEPWITVSPSNGRGSVECEIIIDSALAVTSRTGVVRINNLNTSDYKEFTITQKGFDYSIELKDTKVEIAEYAEYDKRSFDVVVNTNVDFEVVVPEEAQNWLKYKKSDLDLDRGARPRNSVVHFEWKVNTRDISREAVVSFKPVEEVVM